MGGAKRHYELLLGSVYSWFVSASGNPTPRAATWLARHGLLDGAERYLDLGAGFGAHALALARAGKRVTAVDFNPALLAELRSRTAEHAKRVAVEAADLLEFLRKAEDRSFDVVLCLGDTLTHLDTAGDVEALFREAERCLTTPGRLALSYRDSTEFSAQGVGRFIEVARDATRSMHCLLEPINPEHLRVTDIVTELTPEGPRTRLSDYVKLRLAPDRLAHFAEAAGLTETTRVAESGMLTLVFTKSV